MIFALMFFLICGMFLATAVACILLPFLSAALDVVAGGFLAWNLMVLVLMLLARFLWKRAGRMERAYIQSFSGWKRWCLQGTKVLLTVGLVWEAAVIAGCIWLLTDHPLDRLLPEWAVSTPIDY